MATISANVLRVVLLPFFFFFLEIGPEGLPQVQINVKSLSGPSLMARISNMRLAGCLVPTSAAPGR